MSVHYIVSTPFDFSNVVTNFPALSVDEFVHGNGLLQNDRKRMARSKQKSVVFMKNVVKTSPSLISCCWRHLCELFQQQRHANCCESIGSSSVGTRILIACTSVCQPLWRFLLLSCQITGPISCVMTCEGNSTCLPGCSEKQKLRKSLDRWVACRGQPSMQNIQ